MNLPYSFAPLFSLLEKLDMSPDDLVRKKVLSASTVEKIISGQQVMLSTAAKICLALGCELEDVVELNFDFDFEEKMDDGSNSYQPWTNTEIDTLIDLYQNDFSFSEIAKKLDRTPGAVQTRVKELILSGKLVKKSKKKKTKKYQIEETTKEAKPHSIFSDTPRQADTSVFPSEPVDKLAEPEDYLPSCDNCVSTKNGTCFHPAGLCEDYKHAYVPTKWEKNYWPKTGDASKNLKQDNHSPNKEIEP